jgi:hypothetical protein
MLILILIGFLLNILTFLFFLATIRGNQSFVERVKRISTIFAVVVLIPYCFTIIFIVCTLIALIEEIIEVVLK